MLVDDMVGTVVAEEATYEKPIHNQAKRRRLSPEPEQELEAEAPSRIRRRVVSDSKEALQAAPIEPEVSNGKIVDAKSSFATLDVSYWLICTLAQMEVRRPTAIQKRCIPDILAGRDVIGGSRTGSGKTIAFAVPILQQLALNPRGVYALVLTPTRELALQIYEQFNAIAGMWNLRSILVIGGTDITQQAIELEKRPHLVVATPGRLAEHIQYSGKETVAGLSRVEVLVLDEADRLLADGPGSMLPDVATCLKAIPPPAKRQTCVFTATLTQEVMALKDLPRSGNKQPVAVHEVDVGEPIAVPPTLHESYVLVGETHREAYLHVLLLTARNAARKAVMIFCNRTYTTDLLERLLRGLEHNVTSLHSKMPQSSRNSNLAKFRARAARVLVATDVASRGLDIPEVDLVINFDVPQNPDDYVHRVGRTARAGRSGSAVTLIQKKDISRIQAIEHRTGQKMVEYEEKGVNIETRVVRDALKSVGELRRKVVMDIEDGRDVRGNRTRGKIKRLDQV